MRYVILILGLLLLIGGLAGTKAAQIGQLIASGEAQKEAGPPPTAVSSAKATKQTWEQTEKAIGTIAAARGVSINNDAPGVVTSIEFESGDRVEAGQLLVTLDTSVEQAQLRAAKARLDLATVRAERVRKLFEGGAVAKDELDGVEAELTSASADISLTQAQIARKVVKAPFGGTLGIRRVNLGQYLNPGTALTDLEATDTVFVDFTLSQRYPVAIGDKVRVNIEGVDDDLPREGTVAALDARVDEANRRLTVRATLSNPKGDLRPGTFAKVSLVLPDKQEVVIVPATALVRRTFGDSVYVVDEPGPDEGATFNGQPYKIARQQFVQVGATRGDFVAIEKGLEAGAEVVTAGAFKLRNNGRIVVDNSAQAEPQLNPEPENR